MKKRINPIALIGTIFTIVGTILLIIGITLHIRHANFMRNAVETTATIIDIGRNHHANVDFGMGFDDMNMDANMMASQNNHNIVTVSFFVNGIEYRGRLNHSSSNMFIGQQVPVFYNPSNPNHFRSTSISITAIILLPIGFVFFVLGLIFVLTQHKRKSRSKALLANGRKIIATVSSVVPGNIVINNRPSSRLICEYKDKATGNTYMFQSDNILVQLPKINDAETTHSISVYVDYNDYSKYYVDVESFLAELKIVDLT